MYISLSLSRSHSPTVIMTLIDSHAACYTQNLCNNGDGGAITNYGSASVFNCSFERNSVRWSMYPHLNDWSADTIRSAESVLWRSNRNLSAAVQQLQMPCKPRAAAFNVERESRQVRCCIVCEQHRTVDQDRSVYLLVQSRQPHRRRHAPVTHCLCRRCYVCNSKLAILREFRYRACSSTPNTNASSR